MNMTWDSTAAQQGSEVRRRILPPWRVLLHNDDVNDMLHVVKALLQCVPSLSVRQAKDVMLEAHTHGVAQVVICPREHAEMYCERLEQQGLISTIEAV
jgi:ATP-dependent Clp protease adaptor protein ClpS